MEYFNKYGAVPFDGPIETAAGEIDKIADALYSSMRANGASPVEIRAAAEYLGFSASVTDYLKEKFAREN